jgi:hypothetical protein
VNRRGCAASLAARFPGAGGRLFAGGVARADGGRVFARIASNRVFIVDGADDPRRSMHWSSRRSSIDAMFTSALPGDRTARHLRSSMNQCFPESIVKIRS